MIRFFLGLIIGLMAFSATGQEKVPEITISKEELLRIQPNDIVEGNENAPHVIIEYASLSCSHCATFYKKTYPKLKEHYIETGKVRFIYRHFPLNEPALRGAQLAACAPEEKQKKYVEVMFDTQSNWAFKKNFLEILANIAKLGGMSGNEFETCMANKELETQILTSRLAAAKVLDVRSTPTLIINGTTHPGAPDFDALKKLIDNVGAGS